MTHHKKSDKRSSYANWHAPFTEMDRQFLDIGSETMEVRLNGKATKASKMELIVQKSFSEGLKDSSHARSQVIRYVLWAQEKQDRVIHEQIDQWQSIRSANQKRLSQALERDECPRLILPHPDDIEINAHKGVTLEGPIDEQELEKVEASVRERDAYLIQAILEERLIWPANSINPEFPYTELHGGSAELLASFVNDLLPRRFQMSEIEQMHFGRSLRTLSKRELLKEVGKSWRSVGQPKPRGWRTPPMADTVSLILAVRRAVPNILSALETEDNQSLVEILTGLKNTIQTTPLDAQLE